MIDLVKLLLDSTQTIIIICVEGRVGKEVLCDDRCSKTKNRQHNCWAQSNDVGSATARPEEYQHDVSNAPQEKPRRKSFSIRDKTEARV